MLIRPFFPHQLVTNHGPNSAATRSPRNSYCGLSSATSDDNPAPSDYEQQHQHQQPKFGFHSAAQQQQQQQQRQQYHKRSPSSGMHPLDSSTTPTSATTTAHTGPIPGAGNGTMDGIVPKFNTIKLDLKSVTNHPEDLSSFSQQQQQQYHGYHHHQHYQNQHHRQQYRRRFSNPEADQDDENVELKRSGSVRLGSSPSPHPYHYNHSQRSYQQQQHRYSSGSIHSQFKSEDFDEDQLHQRQRYSSQRRVSSPGLGREREHGDDDGEADRHYDKSVSSDTVTGYEHPNLNPNGESPVLTPRRLSGSGSGAVGDDEMETTSSTVKYEQKQQQSSSMNFPASVLSHFTPASTSGSNNNKGSPSRQDSPAMGDVLDGPLKNISSNDDGRDLSSSSSNSSLVSADRRPSSSSAVHMSGSYQHLNGSVSPPRSNSDSYSGSVPMDEDGNPLHPPSQHRHHPGYHHSQPLPQHHSGDYDRAGVYPPSPQIHHQHNAAGSNSSSLYHPHQGGHPQHHYNGPSSSSSMNGGYSTHLQHQYPSYHHSQQHQELQSQYAIEESSGAYHQGHPGYLVHHGHPNQHHHGMLSIPTGSSSSYMQQQQQSQPPPPQAPQRIAASCSGNASGSASTSGAMVGSGGGGRVRGMTSSAKNHCCPVSGCMKRFKRLEHLKRHTKTHTLERPFACSTTGCNKRFSRSDNLCKYFLLFSFVF